MTAVWRSDGRFYCQHCGKRLAADGSEDWQAHWVEEAKRQEAKEAV